MKILLVECLDERLRLSFVEYDCQSVRFAGLAGLKNGELLSAAESHGFDVLLTVDRHIPNQQNLTHRKLSIFVLSAPTNRLRDLLPLVPAVKTALSYVKGGSVFSICI